MRPRPDRHDVAEDAGRTLGRSVALDARPLPRRSEGEQGGAVADRALVDDEVMEAIVLLGAAPVRLSGLATLVWDASAEPRDLEQLTAQCVAELGDHPDATALVQETLVQMLADGVLRPVE